MCYSYTFVRSMILIRMCEHLGKVLLYYRNSFEIDICYSDERCIPEAS